MHGPVDTGPGSEPRGTGLTKRLADVSDPADVGIYQQQLAAIRQAALQSTDVRQLLDDVGHFSAQ